MREDTSAGRQEKLPTPTPGTLPEKIKEILGKGHKDRVNSH